MKTSDFTIGQEVYFRYSDARRHRDGEGTIAYLVAKIGRKWVSLSTEIGSRYMFFRFDPETMEVDGQGFSSPGRVYCSREEFEAESARNKAWGDLCNRIRNQWRIPEHLTLAGIEAMAAILENRE